MVMSVLGEALRWNALKVNVLPIKHKGKNSLIAWKKWQDVPQGTSIVRWWFERKYPQCNLGVMCGRGLAVVDFDDICAYESWDSALKEGYTVRTGKGVHVYFWVREKFYRTFSFEGGEIKGSGYVVAPPSVHENGNTYEYMWGGIQTIGNLAELGIKYKMQKLVTTDRIPQRGKAGEKDSRPGVVGKIIRTVGLKEYLSRFTDLFVITNQNLMCRCPFHDDHDPSMIIHEDQGWCYCFAPHCQAHRRMDVINVASMIHGISIREAIRMLSYEVD